MATFLPTQRLLLGEITEQNTHGMTQTEIYQDPSFPAPDKTTSRHRIRRVDWAGRE